MAIAFSCPSCKAHVQVGDELAGQTGQCPRCERLLIIPSNDQPMPTLLDAEGNPVPILAPVKAPPIEEPRPKPSRYDTPRRIRRREPIEKKPAGPLWPWVLGTFAAIAVVALLFASFLTLCNYRPPEPRSNVHVVESKPVVENPAKAHGVLFGQLQGNGGQMINGVFQFRSALTIQDDFDANLNRHQRRFLFELRGNTPYVFDMDSDELCSQIRVEDRAGNILREDRNPFIGNATTAFIPVFTDTFTVVVTTSRPGRGEYTLTVYEKGRLKPAVR